MTITDINTILASLEEKKRENVFDFAAALLQWMKIEPNPGRPQLISPQTQKLKDFLATAPQTVQPQLYRLSADNQNIRVRFAVLKKLKKEYISQLVDNDPGLGSYQSFSKGLTQVNGTTFIPTQPYFIHFATTPDYDKLVLIFNQGEQKRIVSFRNRLTNTQYHKILEKWQNIGVKPKPEIADLLWKSLDIKEVNKEFYRQIKERFDDLSGIVKTQHASTSLSMGAAATDNQVKQFTVRLIGRYIFCWFLKEKGIIPYSLISKETIAKTENYYQTVLLKLFFQTLNTKVQDRDPLKHNKLFEKIPYLNGGLFDESEEDKLFSNLDLDAWLLPFVGILESYDFTVDESSSNYQQIAIDPEMLGRIFENLLASQNEETEKLANQRKAFGAFYTPREIVDYMVNESLKAHLENRLLPHEPETENTVNEPLTAYEGTLFADLEPNQIQEQTTKYSPDTEQKRNKIKERINKLFATDCSDNPFDKDETAQVRQALGEVTILDPACGSGAFPMGVLLRLMELHQIVGHGYKNNYDLKSEILSKNIYGVDIMPMAIEIARLRAWLSLVLEAEYKPADRKNNFGIAALPNLDFKFVCANSLIDNGYDDFLTKIKHNQTLYLLDGEIKKLETIRDTYFDPKGDKQKKEQLQREFLQTKDHIKTNFASLRKTWHLDDFLNKVDDWNPFDDSHPSSFFSPAWMFGIRDGFDVVIGNPPYVDSETMTKDNPEFREYLKSKFQSAEGNWDLFVVFTEMGLKLCKSYGSLAFIVPNKIISAKYTYSLRTIICNLSPREIIDYSYVNVFKEADVYPVVILISNQETHKYQVSSKVMYNLEEIKTINLINSIQFTSDIFWDKYFFNPDVVNLIIKITSNDKLISKFPNILGAATVNEAYQVKEVIKELEKEKKYFKFTNTGTIDPYKSLWGLKQTQYIKGNYHKPIITKTDLDEINRTRTNQSSSPKIIIAGMALRIEAFYDEYGSYCAGKSTTIILGESQNLKTLTGIINSKLVSYWFSKYFNSLSMAGGYFNIGNNELGLIPLPNLNFPNNQINNIVDKILVENSNNPQSDTSSLEKQIDELVYHLYELTYDEVKIIDKDFWLSEQEYSKTMMASK